MSLIPIRVASVLQLHAPKLGSIAFLIRAYEPEFKAGDFDEVI